MKVMSFIVLLAMSAHAHADSFYKLIRYTCDLQHDQLIISYVGAYNEAGKALVDSKGENAWEPSELVEINGERIVKLKNVKRQCHLTDGIYEVTISSSPYTGNINGHCGALSAIPAKLEIAREGRVIFDQTLEGSCMDTESRIITEVSLAAGAKEAHTKQVPSNVFFH